MAKSIDARVNILADTADLERGMRRSIAATDKFNRSTKRVNRNPFRSVTRSVAGLAGAYIGAQGLITVVQGAVREQQESIKVGRQTNAVLKSTKSAAGLSAKAIGDLAQKLSEKTAIDDEAIQSAENLLLTFTKIGKDTFPAATEAVLDLSAATGKSLSSASIQVGKALQDPIRGISALRKSGVSFSTDQQEVIKKLVDTGKTAEAQKLILKELAIEFGGSAAAQATPLDKLKVTYEELLETLGAYLVPVLNDVAEATIKFVEQFRAGKGAGGEFKDTLISIRDALAPIVSYLVQHPDLLVKAGAAYVAFKATVGTLNLAATLAAVFPTGKLAEGKGRTAGKFYGKGLIIGLLLALPFIAEDIWKLLKDNFEQSKKSWSRVGGDLGDAFKGGLRQSFVTILTAIAGPIGLTLSWLRKKVGSWKNVGTLLAQSFKAAVRKGLAGFAGIVVGAVSRGYESIKRKVQAFKDIGGAIVRGLASGIRGAAGLAIQAAKDLANILPGWVKKTLGISSPSKVFAAIGKNVGDGLVVGMMASLPGVKKAAVKVADAAAFGVGDELAVAVAARNAGMAKTKKGKKSTAAALRVAEGRQRVGEAKGAIKTFLAGISEKIQAAQLAKIMAPVDLARAGRAGREAGVAKGGVVAAISRAQAEAADPRVQAKFARETLRLDARIAQARKSGSLEAIDALQGEKDALDARYGPAYLTGLQDQLDQLNENEIEASSEAAAIKFAAQFSTSMNTAMNTLFKNGSVQGFFAAIGKALTGSGVTPGQLSDISGGVPAAALTIPKKAPKKKAKSKRASGGYLTPGALTLVGETGPELIMGGKVMSSTRTNRMGGAQGMNITVNAVGAAADDPMLLARQLGWQLATR